MLFFFVAKGPNTSEEMPEDVIVGESNEKSPMDDLIEVTDESEDEIQFKSKGPGTVAKTSIIFT
jgi:hypothetical protein